MVDIFGFDRDVSTTIGLIAIKFGIHICVLFGINCYNFGKFSFSTE